MEVLGRNFLLRIFGYKNPGMCEKQSNQRVISNIKHVNNNQSNFVQDNMRNNINNIRRRSVHAFSLIEVLISLAIVSFAILYLLVFAASVTKRATLNKLQIQMSAMAGGILEQARASLYTQQREEDWNNLLNSNAMRLNPQNKRLESVLNCSFDDEVLRETCPSVNTLDSNQYSFLGYVIKPEQIDNNLFKLSIKVACKYVDSTEKKCPQGLSPVIMETYVSKY